MNIERECLHCGYLVQADANFCARCGHPFSPTRTERPAAYLSTSREGPAAFDSMFLCLSCGKYYLDSAVVCSCGGQTVEVFAEKTAGGGEKKEVRSKRAVVIPENNLCFSVVEHCRSDPQHEQQEYAKTAGVEIFSDPVKLPPEVRAVFDFLWPSLLAEFEQELQDDELHYIVRNEARGQLELIVRGALMQKLVAAAYRDTVSLHWDTDRRRFTVYEFPPYITEQEWDLLMPFLLAGCLVKWKLLLVGALGYSMCRIGAEAARSVLDMYGDAPSFAALLTLPRGVSELESTVAPLNWNSLDNSLRELRSSSSEELLSYVEQVRVLTRKIQGRFRTTEDLLCAYSSLSEAVAREYLVLAEQATDSARTQLGYACDLLRCLSRVDPSELMKALLVAAGMRKEGMRETLEKGTSGDRGRLILEQLKEVRAVIACCESVLTIMDELNFALSQETYAKSLSMGCLESNIEDLKVLCNQLSLYKPVRN